MRPAHRREETGYTATSSLTRRVSGTRNRAKRVSASIVEAESHVLWSGSGGLNLVDFEHADKRMPWCAAYRVSRLSDSNPRLAGSERAGYTLVEMLIASVLVAALMSVVWAMMSMYNSYLTAGQSQATEQQLTRSLFQILERDLQSVSAPDTNPKVVPSLEAASESREFPDEPLAPPVDPFSADLLSGGTDMSLGEPSVFDGLATENTPVIPGKLSLVGNSSSIRLSIEQPAPEPPPIADPNSAVSETALSADDPGAPSPAITPDSIAVPEDAIAVEGIAPRIAEYQTIIWQFQAPGIAGGDQSLQAGLYRIQTDSLSLQSALNQQSSLLEDSAAENDASVDRITLETLLFPPADAQAESGGAAPPEAGLIPEAPKFDLIPEVVSCRFEYFSGSSWASTWNSEQQQSLPLAVRVRMQLINVADMEKLKLFFGEPASQDSTLDDAISDSPSNASTSSATPGNADDPAADPLATIRTRQIERIILLQPVTGPIPEPGAGSDFVEPEASL